MYCCPELGICPNLRTPMASTCAIQKGIIHIFNVSKIKQIVENLRCAFQKIMLIFSVLGQIDVYLSWH